MSILIIFVLSFLFFILLTLPLKHREKDHKSMVQRMEYFSGKEEAMPEKSAAERQAKAGSQLQERALVKIRKISRRLSPRGRQTNSFDLMMLQADWPLLGAEFEVVLGILAVLGGLIFFLTTLKLPMLFLGMAAGAFGGIFYLKLHIARRGKAFNNQLGDTLVMMSNALRAGFSFQQAMELIAREMEAPIGVEFQKVLSELALGASIETALGHMSKRVQSKDFDLVITAVLIQRQVGGNLSQILDTISDTIRERIRMRNEISSLTAQGKLSGIIVGAVPFAIVGFLYLNDPHYLQPMLDSTIGKLLLAAAAALELIAVLIIRKIVDIRV